MATHATVPTYLKGSLNAAISVKSAGDEEITARGISTPNTITVRSPDITHRPKTFLSEAAPARSPFSCISSAASFPARSELFRPSLALLIPSCSVFIRLVRILIISGSIAAMLMAAIKSICPISATRLPCRSYFIILPVHVPQMKKAAPPTAHNIASIRPGFFTTFMNTFFKSENRLFRVQ